MTLLILGFFKMLLSRMLSKMVKEDMSEAYSCGVARKLDHIQQFHNFYFLTIQICVADF